MHRTLKEYLDIERAVLAIENIDGKSSELLDPRRMMIRQACKDWPKRLTAILIAHEINVRTFSRFAFRDSEPIFEVRDGVLELVRFKEEAGLTPRELMQAIAHLIPE